MTGRLAIAGLTAAFAVAAAATAGLVADEGWVLKTYPDPALGARLPTGCAGVTGAKYGIEPGRTYSQADCEQATALAMLDHYYATVGCLPAGLPIDSHAAMLRFAYNVGGAAFCTSSVAIAARAGDLKTACARMNTRPNGQLQWVTAGGRIMPGLVKRRAHERAQCERGLQQAGRR